MLGEATVRWAFRQPVPNFDPVTSPKRQAWNGPVDVPWLKRGDIRVVCDRVLASQALGCTLIRPRVV